MAHDCLDCGQMCYCDVEDTYLESLSHWCRTPDCENHPDNECDFDDDEPHVMYEYDQAQYVTPWPLPPGAFEPPTETG
jgi:hypothetical protein